MDIQSFVTLKVDARKSCLMILVTILSPFGVGLSFITVYVTAISLCFTGFVVLQMM